jgi:hypothetical protein
MAEDAAESAGAKAPAITISTHQIILMGRARRDAKPGQKVTTVNHLIIDSADHGVE